VARVVVTRRLPGGELERLRQRHDVGVWEGDLPPTREELLGLVAGAAGLLSMLSDAVDADLLDAAPGLRVVSN
jgi:glyoxylate reductase